jgi:hypothetical protein
MALAMSASLFSATACDSLVDPAGSPATVAPAAGLQSRSALAKRPQPPKLEFKTPAYPAIALHIVYREYVNKHPGIRYLDPEDKEYQRYMEKRLRELYPQRGYAGMMKDAVAEMRRNKAAWRKYEEELREYMKIMCDPTTIICDDGTVQHQPDPSWDGQEEHPPKPDGYIPTIQEEADSLQMTKEEIDRLYYYESLAAGTYRAAATGGTTPTRDDLIRAAAEGKPATGTIEGQAVHSDIYRLAKDIGMWLADQAVRAQTSVERAYQKTEQYYGDRFAGDNRGDAFRHIFWNMQMRRYMTAWAAKTISDRHEKEGAYGVDGNFYGPLHTGSKVMDLHNNAIGYNWRYSYFRGHWLADRWAWRTWAFNVAVYVDYYVDGRYANGTYIEGWATNEPTEAQAWETESWVPDWKYIHFKPCC